MAQATNTTLGTIVLGGDFAGSDAYNPTLSPSGARAGNYVTTQRLYVDEKGRITHLDHDPLLFIPDATKVSKGQMVPGEHINIEVGTSIISVDFPNATKVSKGLAQPGTLLEVDANSRLGMVTTSKLNKGLVRIGTGIDVVDGIISMTADDATNSTKGIIQLSDGFEISYGELTTKNASVGVKGVVSVGPSLDVLSGSVSIPDATNSSKGILQPDGSFDITEGIISTSVDALPNATNVSSGLVQIGDGIVVSSGVISVNDGSDVQKGILQVGTGLISTGSIISVNDGSDVQKGILQVGTGLISTTGVISLDAPDATNSTKGIIQTGDGVVSNSGVLSLSLGDATTVSRGIMKPGTNLSINSGSIFVQDATTSTAGFIEVGSNVNIASGVLSIPNAVSSTSFGLVKASGDITISSGLIDVGPNVAKLDSANTFTKAQATAIGTKSYQSTYVPDFANTNIIHTVLTASITQLALPLNTVDGGVYTIVFQQDATGGRTISSYVASYKKNGTLTFDGAPNTRSVMTIIRKDSSTFYVFFSSGYTHT